MAVTIKGFGSDWSVPTGAKTKLDALYPTRAESALESRARRKAIRNGSPTPLADTIKVALPTTGGLAGAGFTWQSAPINIYGVNGAYTTDFDPEGVYPLPQGTTYYVDTVNGAQANDGLTPATAKSNMQFAYQVAAAGDTIMVLDNGPIYRSGGWQNTKITKSIRVKAANPGVVFACADNLAYTLSTGMTFTYQSARSNVNKVVDMGLPWAPDGYAYKQVGSIAEVEATPASWYNDATNVYVRTIDGSKPDSKRILALLNAQHFYTESSGTGDMHVYMEGIRVLGGSHGMLVDAHTHKVSFYAKNCAFAHSASLGEASANGASFAGATNVYMRNVRTLGSKKDGFNYTANNIAGALKDAPRVIEVDCEAYEHGLSGAYTDTCNASTGHLGAKIIRVNCKGHHTRGAIFADVQTGTQSVNYGCTGWDSLSATTGSKSIFHAQQAGADMWLYGCEAFGADWDVYANSGAWIGLKDTIYTTTNGGGTRVTL